MGSGNLIAGEPTFLQTRYSDPRDANLTLFGVVIIGTLTQRDNQL